MKDAITTRRPLSSRRAFLSGAAALATGVFLAGDGWAQATAEARPLTPDQAHKMARDGEIVLVDIRRPDEWAATGIAEGAIALDMRQPDFVQALTAVMAEDPARPVALICASGGRSGYVTSRLQAAGLTNLVDVPEGMSGSGAGPGWLQRGLPVTGYSR